MPYIIEDDQHDPELVHEEWQCYECPYWDDEEEDCIAGGCPRDSSYDPPRVYGRFE